MTLRLPPSGDVLCPSNQVGYVNAEGRGYSTKGFDACIPASILELGDPGQVHRHLVSEPLLRNGLSASNGAIGPWNRAAIKYR